MIHNDDAFTTMLLTVPITPDREELARPLSPGEFARLDELALKTRPGSLGALIDIDMSGLMLRYGMREADAYRVCMLLSRNLPLSFLLERLSASGIDLVTLYDAAYPARIRAALGEKTPPRFFCAGGRRCSGRTPSPSWARYRPGARRRRTCARWSGRLPSTTT